MFVLIFPFFSKFSLHFFFFFLFQTRTSHADFYYPWEILAAVIRAEALALDSIIGGKTFSEQIASGKLFKSADGIPCVSNYTFLIYSQKQLSFRAPNRMIFHVD